MLLFYPLNIIDIYYKNPCKNFANLIALLSFPAAPYSAGNYLWVPNLVNKCLCRFLYEVTPMLSFPVVQAQLLAPKIKHALPRLRLTDLGLAILSHRVSTVIAPAGYGKSVWVASLLNQPSWPLTAWLSLDSHDNEPACLLYHMVHALKVILTDFGADSLRTLGSVERISRDWSIVVNTIVAELPLNPELVLVLDDFHLIHENTLARSMIEYLIRGLPANVHLVIISRVPPFLNLYQQELSGHLLKINRQHLLFTREETAGLLALLELDLPAPDIESIYQRTEGWAVGLRLSALVIKLSGGNLTQAKKKLMQKNSNLHQYLSHELLASLPEPLQDFFMASSLLPYLEAELCDAAFKRSDSSAMLEELHAQGLLSQVQDQPVIWCMHHLIGEFLADYLTHLRKPEYIAQIRKRASHYMEKTGNIDGAMEQAVMAGDWDRAAGLINKYGDNYYMAGSRQEALYHWIECLPSPIVSSNHRLLYYQGKSLLQIDDTAAVALLSAAAEIAVRHGDEVTELDCILAMLTAQVLTGNMKQGETIGQLITANPSLLSHSHSRGQALNIALGYAIFSDDLQQGLKLSHRALRLKLPAELRMTVLYGSAIIQHRLGKLDYARQLVEEALAMPLVQANERLSVTGYVLLSTILFLSGDTATLEYVCQKVLQLSEKYHMTTDLGRGHRVLARMYLREKMYVEARREFERACYHFAQDDNLYTVPTTIELMLARIKTGENARDLLEETLELLDRLVTNPIGQGGDHYILAVGAIIAMEAGKLESAQYLLETAMVTWHQNGARINQAGCGLLLAHVYLLQGKYKASDSLLKKSLSLAETGQWVNFWEWHGETIYTMCSRAITKNIQINWACSILNRWFPQRCRQELGHLLIANDANLNHFAASFLEDYRKNTGINVIHVFYLGSFRVFVNGQEIPRQSWRTQKAETLFTLLATHRGYQSKEAIIEQLWPDSDYKSGEASLRMALSHIRQALGQHGPLNESVILYRGQIHLNPAIEVYNDYELFRERAKQAQQYRESARPYAINAMEAALHLYNGPFLEGDLDNPWVQNDRISLQNLYLQILEKMALFRYETGNLVSSLQLCQQYLALEPVEESIIRLSMQILHQTGHKRQALSLYRKLERDLSNEYNTPPDPETTILYQELS